MKISNRKFLSILIVIAMLCSTFLGGSVQAADTGITAVFDKNGLKADFKVDSQWTGFFNGTITVTNTGTQPVEDWALTFDFPHEITNIWNAAIIEHQTGVYTVKNLVWNQDIPVGGSINFGFTAAASGEITRPTFFTVNTKTTEVTAERIKVEYVLYSDWGSGYSAALKITNLSATTIEDWTIDFDFTRSISNLSCGKIVAQSGTHYTLQNDGYTQNLSAGQTIQLGLGGTGGVAADVPTHCVVKQIVPGFDLVSDTDGDLVLDWIEICVNGTDPLVPGGVIPTPTPTPIEVTPTPTEPTPTTVEPSPTPTEPTPTPTPTPPVDMETDSDSDLVPDYYEDIFGTDKNNPDTDEDKLSDYMEIICGLDPLTDDSNGDFDEDGLTNGEELDLGTYVWTSDSDQDGLSDYDEVRIYGTDPMNPDSDQDGLSDGDEAAIGKNPNDPSDADVKLEQTVTLDIVNAEDAGVQQVSVKASLPGLIDKTITIRDVYKVDYYTTDVYGRIGSPVSFESTEEFDEATITFSYDENSLGDAEEENLGVLWYDEANGGYIIQEQAVVDTEANTITLTVNHFSTYLVVNKDMWNNPVFPDTSNNMYIAHYTGKCYVHHWYPIDSVDKNFVEGDHYAWWAVDKAGVKIATLYKSIEYSYDNGYEHVYDCTYDWLMVDQTDKDKDGLYDWLETKGIMATNGRVYYTDAGSGDGDTDGVSDLEELGTIYYIARSWDGTLYIYLNGECVYISKDGTIPFNSQYFILKTYADAVPRGFVKPICILNSFPVQPDRDGDTYTDDIDENPLDQAVNWGFFCFSETVWESEYVPVFETIYNTHATDLATWGQHPELADDPKLLGIYAYAAYVGNFHWYNFPNAACAMDHYLNADGTDYTINVELLVYTSFIGSDLYKLNLEKLEEHIKSVLKDGDSICIVSKIPFSANANDLRPTIYSTDWFLTLGAASGAFCVTASRAGDEYTIKGTYYVADNYDFDENDDKFIFPGLQNGDMFKLHSAGVAQAYFMHGEMDMNIVF